MISLVGLGVFFYPFVLGSVSQRPSDSQAQAGAIPVIVSLVAVMCVGVALVTLANAQRGPARSRMVALLGVLVAIDATLRLVPSIGGASPVFLLIMLVGFVFGPLAGFQMGAMTLLLSGFITGGMGPWLPFQMLASGWVGMTAGWLPRPRSTVGTVALLAIFGAVWGLLFGALMNLWFWPFTAPGVAADASMYWHPGLGPGETIRRYATFYVVTSFAFDVARSIGNAALVVVLGVPVIRVLERYRRRFTWEPWEEAA